MSTRNPALAHRPLRPSTLVYNPLTQEAGTLGFFGTTNGADVWMVSCHHVLIAGPHAYPQPVFQPTDGQASVAVADTNANLLDRLFDIAAARLRPGVAWTNDILGLGIPGPPQLVPRVGMRVVKSGIQSGVTEGEISMVQHDLIRIVPRAGSPARTELSATGDSGSLWLEQVSLRPVGLHYLGNAAGPAFACARPIGDVLVRLGMRIL